MAHRATRRHVLMAGAAGVAAAVAPAARAAEPSGGLQPYASYWYPRSLPSGSPGPGVRWRSLSEWRPEDDAELPFNRASVPLAARFTPPPANGTARGGQARISALVSFATTSANPSQGSATADYYALTHWAYLDELVFWGGSSGEGLILAPNAPVVDAAHRNGVPVLGTVFLPPAAYGGQLCWTRELVHRDAGGGFPLAGKLIQVARAHGFDGWFLNAETGGGDARLGADMRDFVEHLRTHGKGLRITWYDAMAISGDVAWQNELNDRNAPFFRAADTMFVNFGWNRAGLEASGKLAERARRSRYELWAGIDVEAAELGHPRRLGRPRARRRPAHRLIRLLPAGVDLEEPARRAHPGRLPRARRPLVDRAFAGPLPAGSGSLAGPGRVRRGPLHAHRPAVRDVLQHRSRARLVRAGQAHLGRRLEPSGAPGPAARPPLGGAHRGRPPHRGLRLRRRLAGRQQPAGRRRVQRGGDR
ncbi:hypothetical protein GCM10020000_10470 [Streptomyces olivoverticillatus]